MFGLAVLALASCSKSSDVYDPTASKDRAQYEQAFINAFGVPAGNQDWGFGTSSYTRATTATRAAAEFGWELSEGYDKQFSKAYYDDVFAYLPEEESAGSNLTNYEFESNGEFQFCIIYSQTSAQDKVGYYYYNPATETVANRHEVQFVDNIQNLGNYVQISYDNGSNWAGMGTYMGVNPWNGSWGSTATGSRAKVFTVNIPAGYRVGFYIINGSEKMYTNQTLNTDDVRPEGQRFYSAVVDKDGESYLVGFEDWTFKYRNDHVADCNDVILAINQQTSTPPRVVDIDDDDEEFAPDVRIMAEDLNASEKSDFDFNDVVFDVQWIDGGAKIRIMAAGGTYPLRINGEDALEVHGLFEVSTKTMVNTFAGKKTDYDPVIKTITGNFVNSDNENDASLIKVEVNKGTGYIELTAPTGKVASKICVDPKVDWCDEYQDIDEKWNGNFSRYVKREITQFWN